MGLVRERTPEETSTLNVLVTMLSKGLYAIRAEDGQSIPFNRFGHLVPN
jgi:hypothetical protein